MKRPVVLVGHALRHDKDNLKKQALANDYKQHGNVVAEIDTQQLVKQEKAWVHLICSNNEIGLDTLCREVFGFAHQDPHTALNDAAKTVICAANIALRNWDNEYKTKSTMQEVVLRVEQHSQDVFESKWGTELCCTRCGRRDHSNAGDQCRTMMHCDACERFNKTRWFDTGNDKEKHISSDIEQFCLHVAEFNAWKRRVFDADRKHNRLAHGPPPASHPPSSWRGVWPMNSASDVLVPEARVFETRPALIPRVDITTTSAPLPGAKVITVQSTGWQRTEMAKRAREETANISAERAKDGTGDRSGNRWSSDDVWNATAR
jgi:hypothetical protein